MRILSLLLCASLLFPLQGAAEEALFETIESQRLIVNWRPDSSRLATVLVYTCDTCVVSRKFIDRNTQLVRGNDTLDIQMLSNRAEWDGHVSIVSNRPERIVRVEIFD